MSMILWMKTLNRGAPLGLLCSLPTALFKGEKQLMGLDCSVKSDDNNEEKEEKKWQEKDKCQE